MDLSRRRFVVLTATAMVTGTACQILGEANADTPPPPPPPPEPPPIFDAGPLDNYASDGVYNFRNDGFFLILRDQRLWAMSAICTHRGCKVRAQADDSFYCRCHRSAFNQDGRVTNGPALRNLPRLAVTLDDRRHVLVNLERRFESVQAVDEETGSITDGR